MNHYESAPPRRNFGSANKISNFPLPEMMTSRRKIDLEAASVTSKEDVIVNVATDKNIQSDRSSILNVDPGSDKKKQKVFVQKTAESIFNGENEGQDFTLVQESDISSPKSGGFNTIKVSQEDNLPKSIHRKEVTDSTGGPTETARMSPSMKVDQSRP